MKAMVYRHYGTPEDLRLEDIEKPRPGDGEVLVRIHATSLNSGTGICLQGCLAQTA
jgi:NADPH:quinone reductase-like Zn-dependent oxidoreductase